MRVTRFARPAVEADSGAAPPLVVIGRVFEMYELKDTADTLLALGPGSKADRDDDDGADMATSDSGWDSTGSSAYSDINANPPPRSRTSTTQLPAPLSSHRWRCLTPTEDVQVPLAAVAGRYYPPTTSVETEVNGIAEKVRRTGLVGEGGIRPLSLGLSGLVSGGKVPRIEAINGIREGVDRAKIATEVAAVSRPRSLLSRPSVSVC